MVVPTYTSVPSSRKFMYPLKHHPPSRTLAAAMKPEIIPEGLKTLFSTRQIQFIGSGSHKVYRTFKMSSICRLMCMRGVVLEWVDGLTAQHGMCVGSQKQVKAVVTISAVQQRSSKNDTHANLDWMVFTRKPNPEREACCYSQRVRSMKGQSLSGVLTAHGSTWY